MGVLDDIKKAGADALAAEQAKNAPAAPAADAAAGGLIEAAEAVTETSTEAVVPETETPVAEAAPAAQAAPAPKPKPAPAKPAPKPEARREAAHKPAPKKRTHTVKSGDTLSAIGAHYGVSWQEIAKVNKIPNPDLIYPGQVFVIPD